MALRVKYQMVNQELYTSDVTNDQLVQTNAGPLQIRMNVYLVPDTDADTSTESMEDTPDVDRVVTADCIPLGSKDNLAQNGVVHTVPRWFEAPQGNVLMTSAPARPQDPI